MLKKVLTAALLAAIMLLIAGSAITETSPEVSAAPEAETDYDVELIVFLFDRCGGCGVDSPGCGNCQDTVRYHGIIKGQLGDRLYDGTILYRMFNCRLEVNDQKYDGYYEAYGLPQDTYGYLPAAFIGNEEGGLCLIGEELLEYVDEYVDAYIDGCDIEETQKEIDALREELRAEAQPE